MCLAVTPPLLPIQYSLIGVNVCFFLISLSLPLVVYRYSGIEFQAIKMAIDKEDFGVGIFSERSDYRVRY